MLHLLGPISFASRSDQGLVRRNNEDAVFVTRLKRGYCLALVADGVGGQEAGEVASQTVRDVFARFVDQKYFRDALADSIIAEKSLAQSTLASHRTIKELAAARPDARGMATTLTCCLVTPTLASFVQVGDSRLYHFNGTSLIQRTDDQTIAAELVEAGRLRPQDVSTHPDRNRLSQALGVEALGRPLRPAIGSFEWNGGDTLLLCSDGLSDMIQEGVISSVVSSSDNVEIIADRLIQIALEAGGKDNVSVVVVRRRR